MYGETNFCGCGNKYPIVPGSNPSLVTWDGQKFVVADGTSQLPINLPYIQHSETNLYLLGINSQKVLTKLKYFKNIPINYLLIGGGGAAGDSSGGVSAGGGGGGVISSTLNLSTNKTIAISVGTGGQAPNKIPHTLSNGNPSKLIVNSQTFTAFGGGYGGQVSGYFYNGYNGSSGGGAGYQIDIGPGTFGTGIIGQGHNGGSFGTAIDPNFGNSPYCGGGGGAGTAAGSYSYDSQGNLCGGSGGNGIASSITGTSVYYGAGGGGNVDLDGGTYTLVGGLGYGGYGSGSQNYAYGYNKTTGQSGIPNLAGFDGVCILSIPTQYFSGTYTNATVTINGANTILTFTQNGTYTT
jgi:hypothetical protein